MIIKKCNSIYDLADIAGVSYATVSRVLNNRGKTSEAAREAVLKAVADHNFKPKMKARKKTIGILISLDRAIHEEKQGYADTMLLRLLYNLSRKGYAIEYFTPHNLENLNNCLLDGVVTTIWNDQIAKVLDKMHNVPKVIINSDSIPGFSRVYSDHEQSGRLAAEYLLDKGHTHAGIILDSRDWGNELRYHGFCKAFTERGCKVDSTLAGFLSEQSEIMLIQKILSAKATAIFIGGEDIIIQLTNTIQMLKGNDQNKLTLISMQNPSVSPYLNPPMTTIAQPFTKIIDKAIEIISNQVENDINDPQEYKMDNILIQKGDDEVQLKKE